MSVKNLCNVKKLNRALNCNDPNQVKIKLILLINQCSFPQET